MRIRNIKNAKEIINNSELVITNNIFKDDKPLYIEIGCGKGNFIIETAKRNPNINFIGIERYESILLRAIKKVEDIPKTLQNEYEKGVKDTKLELEKEHKYATELLKKDFQSTIDRQNDKIESLTEELKSVTNQNALLQDKVDKAYLEIKELASKTVETTGAVKIIGNSNQETIR